MGLDYTCELNASARVTSWRRAHHLIPATAATYRVWINHLLVFEKIQAEGSITAEDTTNESHLIPLPSGFWFTFWTLKQTRLWFFSYSQIQQLCLFACSFWVFIQTASQTTRRCLNCPPGEINVYYYSRKPQPPYHHPVLHCQEPLCEEEVHTQSSPEFSVFTPTEWSMKG